MSAKKATEKKSAKKVAECEEATTPRADDNPDTFYPGDGTDDDQTEPAGDSGDGLADNELSDDNSTISEEDLDELQNGEGKPLLSPDQFPRFRCHKTVTAIKIAKVNISDVGSATIVPEDDDYDSFLVDSDYCDKHRPQAGGYVVIYEDGYLSFSPAEAFEGGYTQLPFAGPVIDRKFELFAINPITGTILTEHNAVVFAAKDAALLKTLAAYLAECETIGCAPEHTESFRMLIERVVEFQQTVDCRVPDTVAAEVPRCIKGKGV